MSFNTTYTYNPATEKVVPKDAVVLDLDALTSMQFGPDVRDIPTWLRTVANANKNGRDVMGSTCVRAIADQIEAQVKPPRIEEPGVGGRVVDPDSQEFTRFSSRKSMLGDWVREDGLILQWDRIRDPKLIRPGV